MKSLRSRIRFPRFNILQLMLLTMLIGIILAMIANARRQQPAQAFKAIAFSPDGTRIAIVGEENTQIIKLADRTILGSIPIGFSGYGGGQVVSFVDHDTVALWCQGNWMFGPVSGVYLYSIADKKLRSKKSIGQWGDSMAVCPAGFAVRDKATSKLTFYPFEPEASPVSMVVRKSDDRIWLSESGRSVTLFSDFFQSRGPNMPGPTPSTEVLDLSNMKTETIAQPYSDAVLSPDGSCILLSGRHGATLLDRATQTILWQFELGKRAEDGRFSQDGALVAVQGKIETIISKSLQRDQFISVLNANSGQELLRIDTNDRIRSAFAFSPSGTVIAVADSVDYFRGVQIWDIPSGKMVSTVGGSRRLQMLVLYLTLLLVWSLIWVRSRSAPAQISVLNPIVGSETMDLVTNKTKSTIGRILYAGLGVAGVAVVFWFSAICFFTMTDAGQYGQLAIWSQSMAILVVVGACLLGVWLMVFGFRRASKSG